MYLLSVSSCVISFILAVARTLYIAKIVMKIKSNNESDHIGAIITYLRLFVLAIVPILNIIMALTFLYMFIFLPEDDFIKITKLDELKK
jgi:hypothetical protein